MTNKPQTCYVELDIRSNTQPDFMMTKIPKGDKSFLNGYPLHVTKLPDRYIFTEEELEAYVNAKQREVAVSFLDSIRMYEHESGNTIYYDERSSEELFDIYLIHPKP